MARKGEEIRNADIPGIRSFFPEEPIRNRVVDRMFLTKMKHEGPEFAVFAFRVGAPGCTQVSEHAWKKHEQWDARGCLDEMDRQLPVICSVRVHKQTDRRSTDVCGFDHAYLAAQPVQGAPAFEVKGPEILASWSSNQRTCGGLPVHRGDKGDIICGRGPHGVLF